MTSHYNYYAYKCGTVIGSGFVLLGNNEYNLSVNQLGHRVQNLLWVVIVITFIRARFLTFMWKN